MPSGLERRHRLREGGVEAERVEQQHVGAVAIVEHGSELAGIGDVADDLDLALGRLDVPARQLGVDERADENDARRPLAAAGEDPG